MNIENKYIEFKGEEISQLSENIKHFNEFLSEKASIIK